MKTILLVEDDPSIQDAVQLIFHAPDYRLIVCGNAEGTVSPDAIVPDRYLIDKHYPASMVSSLAASSKQTKRPAPSP